MILFALAALIVAVVHLVAAFERPRPAVIVSGILWLVYAYYEHQVATGVLCDPYCNIRVDLVLFFPVLGLAASCARQSYLGRPGQMMLLCRVLGVIGLVVLGLVVNSAVVSGLAYAAALGLGIYPMVRKRWPMGRGAQG